MLTIEDALMAFDIIEGIKTIETVPLLNSMGRVLAAPIVSKVDHPPFDKSAMDGYAVISSDPLREWQVLETIAAGQQPVHVVDVGCCSKIMTGAMIPKGADAVVMIEQTQVSDRGVCLINGEIHKGDNICLKGEDARSGDLILGEGCRITSQILGALAACGYDRVDVYSRPRLAVLPTGDEIVLPGSLLRPGQIYNSNGYSLYGQYQSMGLEVCFAGGVADDIVSLKDKIRTLASENDVVVISGGVSMGDFDFVPKAIEELGGAIHFAKVAIKPGKPTLFASLNNCLIFGLPGNPVSTFIITEVLVKPALFRLMNINEAPRDAVGLLTQAVKRKKTDRAEYLPVCFENGRVEPLEYHGSAHLLALPRSNGLIRLDRGIAELALGSEVCVRLI